MKDFVNDLRDIFNDPDNRWALKLLKWLSVFFVLGAVTGGLGIVLAAVILVFWKIPSKKKD